MKISVVAMNLLFAIVALAQGCVMTAQAQTQVLTAPAFSLNSATQIGPTDKRYIDLRGTGVTAVSMQWSVTGTVTAGACAIQGSSTIDFAAPTTVITAQTVTASKGPSATAGVNSNFIRVNCTTPITGTGSVQFKVLGWQPTMGASPVGVAADGSTTSWVLKAGPGRLKQLLLTSSGVEIVYLRIFDSSATVSCAAPGIPRYPVQIPVGSPGLTFSSQSDFVNGITICVTSAVSDSSAAASTSFAWTIFAEVQ